MKANQNMNVKQLKEVVRFHKLNKPHIKLGMKKADLIAGLKKEGHWIEKAKVKKTTKAPVKKAPVKKAPVKKPVKKAPVKKAVKKETRIPPPNIKSSIDWKKTQDSVNSKENYWEWTAKGENSIAYPGETTTYVYSFDSLAKDGEIMDADKMRKGMVEDDEGNSYSISEFKREFRKTLSQ